MSSGARHGRYSYFDLNGFAAGPIPGTGPLTASLGREIAAVAGAVVGETVGETVAGSAMVAGGSEVCYRWPQAGPASDLIKPWTGSLCVARCESSGHCGNDWPCPAFGPLTCVKEKQLYKWFIVHTDTFPIRQITH